MVNRVTPCPTTSPSDLGARGESTTLQEADLFVRGRPTCVPVHGPRAARASRGGESPRTEVEGVRGTGIRAFTPLVRELVV
jgi:hypothetical protein